MGAACGQPTHAASSRFTADAPTHLAFHDAKAGCQLKFRELNFL